MHKPSLPLLFSFVLSCHRFHGGLRRAAIAPGRIAGKSIREHPPGRGELVTDEAEAQQPAAHRVALVLALQRLILGRAGVQSAVVHGQAKLDVGFQLTGVQATLAPHRAGGVEVVKLEKPEFNALPFKEAVQVQSVMLSST